MRSVMGRVGLSVVTIAALIMSLIPPLPAVAAGGETISGGSNITGETDTYIPVTGVTVTGPGSNIVPVTLSVDHGQLSMTTTTGLTFNGNQKGNVLSFEGTVTNVNNALATLRYRTIRAETVKFVAQLTDPGEVFFPGNGHLYEVVNSPNITADDAAVAAAARTKYGATGYLATITSQAENDFVGPRLAHDGWFGARDSNVEGDWEWAFGPEAGTVFYRGLGTSGGAPVGGQYSNWASGEPNNAGNEDCAQFYSDGNGWNDLSCSGSALDYYVVEYGAPGSLPTVSNTSFTITTSYPTPSDVEIANCLDLLDVAADQNGHRYDHLKLTADIDCTGETVTPLFGDTDPDFGELTFRGQFDGQGHTISGLHMDESGDQVGLIARTEGATITNLTISGEISAEHCVGSIAGKATDTILDNVSSSVSITGTGDIGGLAGCVYDKTASSAIVNSAYSGNISASYGNTGGIIGSATLRNGQPLSINLNTYSGTIASPGGGTAIGGMAGNIDVRQNPGSVSIKGNTVAAVNAPDSYYVGGLIGSLYSSAESATIIKSNHFTGQITGINDVGGMIGYADVEQNSGVAISNTVMDQDVIAGDYGQAGGVIGEAYLYGGSDTKITITNTTVSGDIHGDYYAGGLIAYGYVGSGSEQFASIGNTVSGDISGENSTAGGLYGAIRNAHVIGSSVTGNVTSTGYTQTGGAIGFGEGITMTQTSATGDVTGDDGHIGGLGGYIGYGSQISESFATGNVMGGGQTGGLIGDLDSSTVTDSYARGSASGSNQIGGLIGYCAGTIKKSYATGEVSNGADAGGLVGYDDSCTAEDSFWDTQTSAQAISPLGNGKTTAQMKNKATFTDTANSGGLDHAWDFDDTWGMVASANNGYPCLTWTGGACAGPEDDGDGIPAEVENDGPNGGDANNDGTLDSAQRNVASFVNAINGKYVTVVLDSACSITSVTAQSEASQAAQDAGFTYDNGLVHFTADCGTPGYSTTVKIYQYGVAKDGLVLRKYNPSTHAYFTVGSAALSQQTIGGKTATIATYTVTDGGLLDTDGAANGTIVDPVGLAVGVVGAPNTGLGGKWR